MGIKTAAEKDYSDTIRELFPKGEYWERQFSDPESDINLFCKVKSQEIISFRKRMFDLLAESNSNTSAETLDDWERVLLGKINFDLDAVQRKNILNASKAGNFHIETIKEIGRLYGITITDVVFPFRPAFFGHTLFGINLIASPAAFAVLFIYASQPEKGIQVEFENQLISRVLANYIVYFIYGGA